jgi:hypothetical protein
MAPSKKSTKTAMTDEHKQALATGREQGRAVRRYLEALETNRPRRGRKRTPDSINRRLVEIDAKMAAADPLTRLQLVQERMNLQAELEMKSTSVDLSALEQAFVDAAGPYSARKGISFAAWRTAGVDAAVLKRAGIRSSGS